ncbi:MAG: Crp/Fnr family transcriptional regulator [Deltaproteobacteria bacterium]|nr:Crp/Fnr family transcriptional regulator [Deltaproteobacteria bacterium]
MNIEEKTDILKKLPIFSSLDQKALALLSGIVRIREYDKGAAIFREGDRGEKLGIVLDGAVRIIKNTLDGKEFLIRIISRNGIFGEVAVFDDHPYPATAVASSKSLIAEISRNELLDIFRNHIEIAWHVIADLSRKLRDVTGAMKEIAFERVEHRIAALLLKLADENGEVNLTKQEIANMCGTTVETAIRVTRKFEKKGLTRSARGKIVIVDRKGLENMEGE